MNGQTILKPCEFLKELQTKCIDVYPTEDVQWIINNLRDDRYCIEITLYDGLVQISTHNTKEVLGHSEAYNEYHKVKEMEIKRHYGNDVL